jgi:hypothetical protein
MFRKRLVPDASSVRSVRSGEGNVKIEDSTGPASAPTQANVQEHKITAEERVTHIRPRGFVVTPPDVESGRAAGQVVVSNGGEPLQHEPSDMTHADKNEPETKKKKTSGMHLKSKQMKQNVRMTTLIDMQRDVCKDYYETGNCPYGDTCIYAHIRKGEEDDLSGALRYEKFLEERKQKELIEMGGTGKDRKGSLEEQKCSICGSVTGKLLVTMCGHYFCQCIMSHFQKGTTKCPQCRKETRGIVKVVNRAAATQ